MILVETLEEMVYQYLHDPIRSTTSADRLNVQDLVGHIAEHLRERGIDIGFVDGSRLTVTGGMPRQPEPQRHRLPLVLQDQGNGHVRIFCDGRDCVWSWLLYPDSSPHTHGDAIGAAIQHVLSRHSRA